MSGVCIGNDVVDISTEYAKNKVFDLRFIARVFTAKEEDSIRNSSCLVQSLWLHWAAKESAFKIAAKLFGQIPFSHKKFEFDSNKNTITYDRIVFDVSAISESEFIHCFCVFGKPRTLDVCIRRVKNEAEHSRDVRNAAVSLISKRLSFDEVMIQRPLSSNGIHYPVAVDPQTNEVIQNLDITLSHDGEWIAAAIASV